MFVWFNSVRPLPDRDVRAMSDTHRCRERCPICARPTASAEPAIRSEPPAEALPFGAQGAFRSGYTGRRVFFTYYRCGGCGGLYCPIYFTPAQLEQLYGHQPENMAEVPLPARAATQRGYFEIFRRHSTLDGEYLELGPDIGLFAGLCAERGRFTRFHLFEPNQEVHSALAERLTGQNFRISAEPYRAGTLAKASVSTAVLIHVLDHLIEPDALLESLHSNLAPGGILFIVTHDESSLVARALGRRWPPYTVQHPQLFSPRSVSILLERSGFRVVELTKTVNYFPIVYLLRSVFMILGLEQPAPRFDHPFTVKVRLGNIAVVGCKPA